MRFAWLVLTFSVSFGCKTGTDPNTLNARSSKPELSELIKEEFGHGSGLHNLSFKLSDNGSYDLDYGSEGWYWRNQGQYTISGNSLLLKATKCEYSQQPDNSCQNTFRTAKCVIREQPTDIEYLYELFCEFDKHFRLFTSDSKPDNTMGLDIKKYKVPNGAAKKFQAHDIIVLANVTGTVNSSVVLREGPGITYKKTSYIVNAYDGPYLPSVPKGKKVTIHARTTNKQKVQEWENYWLLVSIDDSHKAWAFGQFIDF